MLTFHQHISHRMTRAVLLRAYDEGRYRREEICEADPLLLAAARFHGEAVYRRCPICESQLHEVRWIYSEHLGRRSGTARSLEEIEAIVAEEPSSTVSVHLVEVCLACHWNYLLNEAIADIAQAG